MKGLSQVSGTKALIRLWTFQGPWWLRGLRNAKGFKELMWLQLKGAEGVDEVDGVDGAEGADPQLLGGSYSTSTQTLGLKGLVFSV